MLLYNQQYQNNFYNKNGIQNKHSVKLSQESGHLQWHKQSEFNVFSDIARRRASVMWQWIRAVLLQQFPAERKYEYEFLIPITAFFFIPGAITPCKFWPAQQFTSIYFCLAVFCWAFLAVNVLHGKWAGLTHNRHLGGPGFLSGLLPRRPV
jgi:hypothetical protein